MAAPRPAIGGRPRLPLPLLLPLPRPRPVAVAAAAVAAMLASISCIIFALRAASSGSAVPSMISSFSSSYSCVVMMM